MTLSELEEIEKKLKLDKQISLNNIEEYIQYSKLNKSEKTEIKIDALEIYDIALRMIGHEKKKLRSDV